MAFRPRRLFKNLPLQTVFTIPFALQLIAAVGVVGYLSFKAGQQNVQELADQVRTELSARIHQQLAEMVEEPYIINQINANSLLRGEINVSTGAGTYQLWQQAKVFPTTNLVYCATASDGAFLGVGRSQGGIGEILQTYQANLDTDRFIYNYDMDMMGQPTLLQKKGTEKYDPRIRPWYIAAQTRREPTWSNIYLDFETLLPTITASTPVFSLENAQLIGICAVDIILSKELNTFLRNLEISESGLAFIVDDDNYLIASSTPEPTTVGSGTETHLLAANHSENPIIRQSVSHLLTEFETIAGVPSMRSDFRYDGDRYHLEVLSFNDDYGLDWLVVVVVPEADFMAHLHQNMRVAIALSIVALLFTIVCGYLITQWLTRPLHHLNQQAKEMARGEWQNFVPLDRGDVIGDLSRSFTTMANQLQSSFHLLEDRIEERTVELMELNQELQRLANIDGLTQIANRRFFDHTLEQEWHRLGIAQKPLSLIFCDVDFFKNYNDTYGHQIGDECLQKIAKLLTQSVRASTDLVARYGGEEFAIILPEADETAALRVAQAIAQKLAALAIPHGASERGLVTLSMGLATVTPAERHRLRSLLTAADLALYTAKAQGRNQVFLASALPLETSPLRL